MTLVPVRVLLRVSHDDPSDIYALFPDEPGTNDPDTCTCYQTQGGHSSADLARCMANSRNATTQEAAALARELERIGYDVEPIRAVNWRAAKARRLKAINRESVSIG